MLPKCDFAKKALLLFSLSAFSLQAIAAPRQSIFEREKLNALTLSEYIYGDEMNQKLMPIFLLGAVAKPGIYHVPAKTDLTTLLSIAGGPTEESSIGKIMIKNDETNRKEEVDFESMVASSGQRSPQLQGRDVVYVPVRQPLISGNTLTVITVTATVLATALTFMFLRKELK